MLVAAVIQARMGSSRLPGKVLRRVGSQAVLTHVLARAKHIPGVDVVHVTTTRDVRDDAIVNRCRGAGVGWTRGQVSLPGGKNDVLAGYVEAQRATGADVIMRLTSDCPMLDPNLAGELLALFRSTGAAYASNDHPPTFYDGCDMEVFSAELLLRADREAAADEREHVTTWMWRHESRVFNLRLPPQEGDWSALKLSIDEPADLRRVRRTWDALSDHVTFTWRDVVVAYHYAHPMPVLRRALGIYGAGPAARSRVCAYLLGAVLATRDPDAPRTWPRATPEDTARVLGFEDAQELHGRLHEEDCAAADKLVELMSRR